MTALSAAGRVATYVVAAAVAVLLLATISERRLASYGSGAAVVLLALVTGGFTAAIAPLLRRIRGAVGCLPFAVVALVLSGAVFAAATTASPAIRMTPLGVAAGAVLVVVATGIVFSLWDEPTDGE